MNCLRRQGVVRTSARRCGLPRRAPANTVRGLSTAQPRRLRTSRPCAAAPSDVFVFDLDGVLVDSQSEVSTSGYLAASSYWKEEFQHADSQAIKSGLKQVFPVLVRGYESMVQARLLLKNPDKTNDILHTWDDLLPSTLSQWQLDSGKLTAEFERHRSKVLDEGLQKWLDLVKPFEGLKELIQYCESPFYIITVKAADKASLILKNHFGLDIDKDSPRLMGGLYPPETKKADALKEISERPVCKIPGIKLHYVDDRLATLAAMSKDPHLDKWRLYLAGWGYNTQEQRDSVNGQQRIQLLPVKDFTELVKWGILMGVDDGCQDMDE